MNILTRCAIKTRVMDILILNGSHFEFSGNRPPGVSNNLINEFLMPENVGLEVLHNIVLQIEAEI